MSYNSEDIQTLEFPYNVQKRMNMYLGNSAKDENTAGACNVAIREVLDNAVTEAMKGHADEVTVTFKADGTVIVEDNGRGIPTNTDKETGKTGIEKCLATLHSGGNFNNKEGKNGPGLNGVGGSVVNALSEYFKVEVFKNGYVYTEEFSDGVTTKPMKRAKYVES